MVDQDEWLRQMDDQQVVNLWVLFHDYNGRACAKSVPRAGAAGVVERGMAVAHANLDFTLNDQQTNGAAFLANTGDFLAVPDSASYALVPYRPGTARVHTHMRTIEGAAWDGCPRTRLEAIVDAYAAEDLSVRVGFEPEFTLFTPTGDGEYRPADRDPMYSLAGLDRHAVLARRLLDTLPAMGIAVEQFGKEYGPAQYELNIGNSPPVRAVDNYLILKDVVHALAREAGWIASFMPKPYADQVGNGLHVHLSLWDKGGTREVSLGTGDEPLAAVGRYFLGGLLAHAPALTGLGAPIVNSYKRLQPGTWAPAHICWSVGNRAALVRIPDLGRRRHLELRVGDNACNPFLYLTGILAAGLTGIRNKTAPPPPMPEDVGHFSTAQAAEHGLAFLPRALPDALGALEADAVIADALGPIILPEFLKLKRTELAGYEAHVHPWERRTYLEAL